VSPPASDRQGRPDSATEHGLRASTADAQFSWVPPPISDGSEEEQRGGKRVMIRSVYVRAASYLLIPLFE
jgi:hypothetical protein